MCPLNDVPLGRYVPWMMCPLDNGSLGRCVTWTKRPHTIHPLSGGEGEGLGGVLQCLVFTEQTSFKPLVTDLLDFGKIGFNSHFY
jgi:hypothetical protein